MHRESDIGESDIGASTAPGRDAGEGDPASAVNDGAQATREEIAHMRDLYQFGIDEVLTKVDILRREFERSHDYSPIEHVRSRLKSVDSIIAKAHRIGCDPTVDDVRASIADIAGIRITATFVSDLYWVADMLAQQPDLTIVTVKDYVAEPKPNGYRSLHLIVKVPVFLSSTTEHITVELQIRTMAMDFWASIEHKLFYKYRHDMPANLASELADAARLAATLDERMGTLRDEVRPMPVQLSDEATLSAGQRAVGASRGQ
ncbi:GTP pyrophosphokinase [Demequina muriae]|uniref:GTP pyrophosphokinase family protein n=1 Tax=Demequina muriae TaxID=3051664 RepID=A0ABT8GEY5_9MICO|nr:GTP pyrophosphokinase family protein [Demequina sp. EGI L300058]MDN4479826.1 GTP pyrophosphokinase family protein [Demequina sp. EGI L300058]